MHVCIQVPSVHACAAHALASIHACVHARMLVKLHRSMFGHASMNPSMHPHVPMHMHVLECVHACISEFVHGPMHICVCAQMNWQKLPYMHICDIISEEST